MSFRGRLLLFFTSIVVIPMIAVALVLFSLTEDAEHGKVDARLAGGLRTTLSFYDEARESAREPLAGIARDDELTAALTTGDDDAIEARVSALGALEPDVTAIAYYGPEGRLEASAGRIPVAAATAAPTTSAGRRLGTLAASVTTGRELAERSAGFTGLDVRILRRDRVLATTIPGARSPDADSGDVTLAGEDYRARGQDIREGAGPPTRVHVLEDASAMSNAIAESRLLIGLIMAGFLVLSLLSSVFVVRALQRQVANFLEAARRLGGGDFDERVPVEGDDEFAALGQQFNTMAEQLETHIEEIERKRRELEDAIRRIGEAFGTGLDRQGVVDLAVRTAIEACDAHGGRLLPVDPRELDEVRLADDPGLVAALEAAEREVFADRGRPDPAHALVDGVHALAVPLTAHHEKEGPGDTIAAISIARRGTDFTTEQRELLAYLVSQTNVSLENADLHRRIARQAITDELTGLSNVRHFHELLDQEIERAQRFSNPIGLVMVDIDNFKGVNDAYGHPQGDLVLKEVARVLREQSRDIDFPARYGGEEMSVILPQTDIGGAAMLAERMREAIEQLRVRRLDGDGVLALTASFGVASLPGAAVSKRTLIQVADEALYRAKRGGKNRVERAEAAPEASPGSR
ncbi:MAG TPA: diguanylate cyclase [Thermoleophilaceae bacterium]|nr:diguanylate cyclase [Thermoleophilaceae bacterium]